MVHPAAALQHGLKPRPWKADTYENIVVAYDITSRTCRCYPSECYNILPVQTGSFQLDIILGLYWGYIGIMEKKMETTINGSYRGHIEYIWGLYWDNGKENGSYYLGFRVS